ncbi:ExeM/NucH family extracellular endonuclease [Parashewanella spongiae]|uniref:ExeM/NucH family extracellular endonuclease n=1 Tax=Parashewanella spongiae TaxID=342950 RepID=A0A3A6TBX5_9GAMM|nr:ExeM/NucH family extracellular endonuclease [Parashewanella spongiae]MCL1078741.1 ExeM/NucH family extracellular endonuclease [Parashewanella spongiae]RJY12514.1 ExeM/NucH family extracellular endonuclease [Parashewanella spongiae]
MKKSFLSLAIASTISMGAFADVNDLLITEMTQSSNGEVGTVEITNTGSAAYTFDDSVVAFQHSNGRFNNKLQKGDGTQLLTGVVLEPGESVVVVNKFAKDDFKADIEENGGQVLVAEGKDRFTNLFLSSDDGFYLTNNDTVIDRVGMEGEGSKWAPNTTLRRKLTAEGAIPAQAATFDITQWQQILPLRTDDLGKSELPAADVEDIMDIFECPSDQNTIMSPSQVQGTGFTSPLIAEGKTESDERVAVEGIISAMGAIPNEGFYLRNITPDGNPETSDGIFVSTSAAGDLKVGQTICIGSKVAEFGGQTQLSADTAFAWNVTDTDIATQATDIKVISSDNGSFDKTLERYEGMFVNLPEDLDENTEGKQDMRITRSFSFNFLFDSGNTRNNMVAAYKRPNLQPNHLYVAGSPESKAAYEQNNDYRLVIESATKASNDVLPYYPDFNSDPHTNYVRIDDSLINAQGMISQYETELIAGTDKFEQDYSLTISNDLTSANFIHNLPRTDEPELSEEVAEDDFAIRISSQNLFNFFNSPFGGDNNRFGQSRGAESFDEYINQRTKLVEIIRAQDADVMAFMEIENNGFGAESAIAEIVNEVNVLYVDERARDNNGPTSTENRYVFVGFDNNGNQMLDNLDAIGSDAIATGIIYRPSKLSIERTRVIPMPQQKAPTIVNDLGEVIKDQNQEILENGQNYHRDALVVTFVVNQTGKRLTLAVNHLKSKGSTCWEEWQGVEFGDATTWNNRNAPDADFQGSCAEFRVAGAVHLGEEMEDIPGDKIILGDLNAYGKEDPVLVLTENPRNKTIVTASHTFLGPKPQFNEDGSPATITKTYGYIDIVGEKFKEKGKTPWSYSFSDEIGSLDHILVSPSLKDRVIDATDWHVNAAETGLYDYQNSFKGTIDGTGAHKFYRPDIYRASDHDPALLTLSYKPGDTDKDVPLYLPKLRKLLTVPYQIPAGISAQVGDVATVSMSPENDEERLDLTQMVLPNVVISNDTTALVNFEVFGAPSAIYDVTVSLQRDGKLVEGSEQTFQAKVSNRDSLIPDIIEEEVDHTGGNGKAGSAGFISLLSLFGLAAVRRRLRK